MRSPSTARHHDGLPAGISVDSWGVDFGLLDSSGALIGNPFTTVTPARMA